ncbi:hypothetical protein HGM15179_021577, partial [Zosterops borbonicus]
LTAEESKTLSDVSIAQPAQGVHSKRQGRKGKQSTELQELGEAQPSAGQEEKVGDNPPTINPDKNL